MTFISRIATNIASSPLPLFIQKLSFPTDITSTCIMDFGTNERNAIATIMNNYVGEIVRK